MKREHKESENFLIIILYIFKLSLSISTRCQSKYIKMNHFSAFIDPLTISSVSPLIRNQGRSVSHLNRRGYLSIPRTAVFSNGGTRLAAFPAALILEAAAEVDPQLFADSSTLTGSNVAYATEFSATVDPNASSVVLFIMLVFGALKFRTDSISSAAKDRKEFAKKLKVARVHRITGEVGIGTEGGAYAKAELAYRDALDKENKLRTILPRIEMMNPGAPVEDMRKESQELLPDLKFQYWDESERRNLADLKPTYSKEPEKLGESRISVFEVLMLSVAGLSNIALLFLFTYDPMQSSVYSSSFMTAFNS